MSRFFLNALHPRRYPLCGVGYQRSREHLLAWKVLLPSSVKEAIVSLSQQQLEMPVSPHSGSWLFLYENIPQLRYHNPTIKFSFEAHQDADSKISFTLDDGECNSIVTTELRQKEIRTKIEELISHWNKK